MLDRSRARGPDAGGATFPPAAGLAGRLRGAGGMRVGVAGAALCALALLAGCGESVALPDLFVARRMGGGPGAGVTLLINEGGSVHCSRGHMDAAHLGATHQLSDPQLVLARTLSEELQGPSAKHLALAPRPGSVFRYYVRDAEGWVRFADNSAGQPQVFHRLAFFVLEVAQKVCGLD